MPRYTLYIPLSFGEKRIFLCWATKKKANLWFFIAIKYSYFVQNLSFFCSLKHNIFY
jgi:hypothetical protein